MLTISSYHVVSTSFCTVRTLLLLFGVTDNQFIFYPLPQSSKTKSINHKNKDGTVAAVKCLQLVVGYNRFMGDLDHNDQTDKLYKPIYS